MTFGAVLRLAERTTLSCPSTPTRSRSRTAECGQILRDPTNGQIAAVDVTYSNNASVETSGLDIQLNWDTEV